MRELAVSRRRRARDPRLRAARPRRHARRAPERLAVAGVRRACRVTDLVGGPFTPPGFYYKTFIRPRRLWPFYERVLRRRGGPRPAARRSPQTNAPGAASTAAATATCSSSAAGRGPERGARRRATRRRRRARRRGRRAGRCAAVRGRARAGARARRGGAPTPAWRSSRRAAALGLLRRARPGLAGDTLHQVRAACHVAATGAIEQPLVFADNDLPGRDARRRRAPARRALRRSSPASAPSSRRRSDRGLDAALALHAAGVTVAAVADLRAERVAARSRRASRPPACGWSAARRSSARTVASASRPRRWRRVGGSGVADRARLERVDCDLRRRVRRHRAGDVAAAPGRRACALRRGQRPLRRRPLPEGVFAAGELSPATALEQAERSGRVAGLQAALALGRGSATERDAVAEAAARARRLAARAPSRSRRLTRATVVAAAVRSSTSTRTSPRRTSRTRSTRATTRSSSQALHDGRRWARRRAGSHSWRRPACWPRAQRPRRGTTSASTTARPPWTTVPLGAFAGRPFEPAKRSAHPLASPRAGRDRQMGGRLAPRLRLRRPRGRGARRAESAGLVDVSSLGKLLVRGPDAGELLDRLYPNRLSTLAPGRVRYGVLTSRRRADHRRRHDLPARRATRST